MMKVGCHSGLGELTMSDDQISKETLAAMLLRMFEFAPVAMAITTSSLDNSSYVKVNDAYLRLTGLTWDEIKGTRVIASGTDYSDPARMERRRLLDEEGGYRLEEVELRHVDGTVIPTLISAQRTEVGDRSYDVEIILDISVRVNLQRQMEQALIKAARTDALTGLPNRSAFDDHIRACVRDAHLDTQCLMLAFIDLNGFKAINDGLGHAMGDRVLQTLAARLTSACRQGDFVARLGGDEFIVMFRIAPENMSAALAAFERIMEQVFVPMRIDDHMLEIGAAIGTATFDPQTDTPESLLTRADQNMYQAKSFGAGLRVVFDGGRA